MVESKYSVYDVTDTPIVSAEAITEDYYDENGLCYRVTDAAPVVVDLHDLTLHSSSHQQQPSSVVNNPTIDSPYSISSLETNNTDNRSSSSTGSDHNPTSTTGSNNGKTMSKEEEERQKIIVASGVASGTFGLLLCGPLGAAVFGFGAAYAAKKKPEGDSVGDAARAIGDVAILAAEKARVINEKHKVLDQTKSFAQRTYYKLLKWDREYHIVERTGQAVKYSWVVTVEFVQKHQLIERGIQNLTTGVTWIVEKISEKVTSTSTNSQPASSSSSAAASNGTVNNVPLSPSPWTAQYYDASPQLDDDEDGYDSSVVDANYQYSITTPSRSILYNSPPAVVSSVRPTAPIEPIDSTIPVRLH